MTAADSTQSLSTVVEIHDQNSPQPKYKALYAVEFFQRKQIASYALWAVSIREGHKYPKIPTGYGKTDTLEQAHLALTAYCEAQGLTFADLRQEIIPWRLVKDLLEGKNGAEFFARSVKKRAVSHQILEINLLANELVHVIDGKIFSDSRKIAEKFDKRHGDVLRAIDNLPHDDFWKRNFASRDYLTERGKQARYFEVAWKGFSILAMGFTGDKAYQWKQDFLDAFEALGDEIDRIKSRQFDLNWQQQRLESKVEGTLMNATLQMVRAEQGKATKPHHYTNEARLINGALTGEFKALDRTALNAADLALLAKLELKNTVLIGCKVDYADRKAALQQYAIALRTPVQPALTRDRQQLALAA